jgi:hypothetical protein
MKPTALIAALLDLFSRSPGDIQPERRGLIHLDSDFLYRARVVKPFLQSQSLDVLAFVLGVLRLGTQDDPTRQDALWLLTFNSTPLNEKFWVVNGLIDRRPADRYLAEGLRTAERLGIDLDQWFETVTQLWALPETIAAHIVRRS